MSSNPYYVYSGSFIPGTLGRAEAVAAEFQSVQAGFADLATAGTDTGTPGAYSIATPAGQPTTYADGASVTFKANGTNPGASTISVNGGATVPLLQYNGSNLQASNITANSWYTVTYNSTYGGWCLPGAVAITFAGSISSAAPVYPVQLTAVGGSSTSAMPIDAKLAISTAISPTWVGNHTFTGTSTFSGPTTISGTAVVSGPLSVSGTSSFSGPLTISGTSTVSGPLTVSGLLTVSGTATFSGPLTVSGTATLGSVNFSGAVVGGAATGGAQGAGTINATGLYVNGVAVSAGASFTTFVKGADTSRASVTSPSNDPDLITGSLAAGTYIVECWMGVTDSGTSGFKFTFNFTGTQVPSAGANATVLSDNINPASGFYRTNAAASLGTALSTVANSMDMFYTSFILVVSVAGVLSLQWSQNSSQVAATVLKKGSTMRYQKVA